MVSGKAVNIAIKYLGTIDIVLIIFKYGDELCNSLIVFVSLVYR